MSRPPSWTVVLIVEDDSDGQALKALVKRLGLPIRLDWLPAHGIGEIKRRGRLLIALARDRIRDGRGCMAVLLDRDGKDVARSEPHRTIRRLCKQEKVPLLLAVEALEAWLLADAGCAGWLGITSPSNVDSVAYPKKQVERAYRRRTGRPYTRRARRILAEKADGSAPEHSPSLRQVLAHLHDSPCGEVSPVR
ncbi:MAG: hypothetical protein D6759_02830 [Chloroflexi bacterium]|nr:MAG: hypothetical protein D6759_02830 [Chloroflexota bacterium]